LASKRSGVPALLVRPVVRREEDEGVSPDPVLLEPREDPADVPVEPARIIAACPLSGFGHGSFAYSP